MEIENTGLLNNIEILRKERRNEIKIGDLEKQLEVSPGYFSRLGKNPKSLPSLNLVVRIAEIFRVSVDFLLVADVNAITETEKLVLSFINKVRDDTIAGKLQWYTNDEDYIPYYNYSEIGKSEKKYGCKACLDGSARLTRFNDNNLLKLTPCKFKKTNYSFYVLEIVDSDSNKKTAIADGGIVREIIQKALNELYISILHESTGLNISLETQLILNEYLSK